MQLKDHWKPRIANCTCYHNGLCHSLFLRKDNHASTMNQKYARRRSYNNFKKYFSEKK